MKAVYRLINGSIQSEIVDDNYQIQPNETFIKPADGIYQPFSFSEGMIVGVSESEWVKNLATAAKNKSTEEIIADLAQQFAETQRQQAVCNTGVLKQIAAMQQGGNK